nr:immunoglobulin light chain junction region [Macaca mulatta]MOW15730.1 immunoglobulin light chain junction region [Macaca mulatta]MOW16008.1 immunoglobulin light chain junction region [Macaca mulatta]MOW17151.1 immunoglobulin light chain junction region [Macaca mulatta]
DYFCVAWDKSLSSPVF